jgi:hypothetical protein
VAHSEYWYGLNLLALDRLDEAEAALRSAAAIFGRLDADGTRHHRTRVALATAIGRSGRRDEAVAILRSAAEALQGTPYEAVAIERLRDLGEG